MACETRVEYYELDQTLLMSLNNYNYTFMQEGVTPLMHAMRRCDLEMVKVLIEGGADIGAQNEVISHH